MSASSTCKAGERRVEPQYPECVQKCVPDNEGSHGNNEDDGDDSEGCRDPQNGKLYKAGETWFTEDCITHGCDEQGNIFGMSASSTCKNGERRVEPQYPECVQKCVPDNEGSHGNNEDDGILCSEGKYPNGTCKMYTMHAFPPDNEDDNNK